LRVKLVGHLRELPTSGRIEQRFALFRFAETSGRNQQNKPGRQRCVLFVLRPGRTKGRSEFGQSSQESVSLRPQSLHASVHKFPLLDAGNLQPTIRRRVAQRFAEKFYIRSVDQSMGEQNTLQTGQRLYGGKQERASRHLVSLFLQVSLGGAKGSGGQLLRLGERSSNERASLLQRHSSRGVIWLTKSVTECFHQV